MIRLDETSVYPDAIVALLNRTRDSTSWRNTVAWRNAKKACTNCTLDRVGDAHLKYNTCYKDVITGRVQPATPTTTPHHAPSASSARTAYCVPPLYAVNNHTMLTLLDDVAYHEALGVAHTFVYLSDCADTARSVAPYVTHTSSRITWLCLDWLSRYHIWQRGQSWQINECVHRARNMGFDWVMNKDFDERVVAVPSFRLDTLSDAYDAYDMEVVSSSGKPYCDKTMCLTDRGLRKVIVRTAGAVRFVNIHHVPHSGCFGRKCLIKHLSRGKARLRHLPRPRNQMYDVPFDIKYSKVPMRVCP